MKYKFLIFTSKAEIKIMKYVGKTPKLISEITKGTKIPIASTYRILEKLEGKKRDNDLECEEAKKKHSNKHIIF